MCLGGGALCVGGGGTVCVRAMRAKNIILVLNIVSEVFCTLDMIKYYKVCRAHPCQCDTSQQK